MFVTEPIEVWRVSLDECQFYASGEWREMLSREEQSRADSFLVEDHRRDYVVAHLALRILLGRRLGVSPEQVKFLEGSFAASGMHGKSSGRSKPALMLGTTAVAALDPRSGNSPDLRFNLSHTRGSAVIGLACGRELGVDIERQRPMGDLDAIASSVMSAKERMAWRTISEKDQECAFYRLWTRKEAYLKAIGLGLFRSLQAVTVPVMAQALDIGTLHMVEDAEGSGAWQVLDIGHSAEYAAAVCLEGAQEARLMVSDLEWADWV
jgi:4'-phosphopantetheinyl transferase